MNQVLYDELVNLARTQRISAYSDVSPLVGLSMTIDQDREQIALLLSEIAWHEHQNNRPMLTSLIVHKGGDNNPGEGFFAIAKEFSLFNGSRDPILRLEFWANQVRLVHNLWASA